MNLEKSFIPTPKTSELSEAFSKLNSLPHIDTDVFQDLEQTLTEHGFSLAKEPDVREVFQNNSLYCRSESFSKVLELISGQQPISIHLKDHSANLCIMASGEGFRTAMLEGFSGKDVDGVVKVVMVFNGNHLISREKIALDQELWKTKPKTAQVSVAGSGQVHHDDVRMVSFRFPVRFFPESLLNDSEKDQLEEGQIKFIVRHYIPKKETTMQ